MTNIDEQSSRPLPSKVSRRTLAAGAAWSVPVIAVASAAPAYALSRTPVSFTSVACKHSGGSQSPYFQDYHYEILVTPPNPCTDIVITGVKMGTSSGSATAQSFCINSPSSPPNAGCTNFGTSSISLGCSAGTRILHIGSTNSSNNYVAISYTVNGVPFPDASTTQTTPVCDTDDVCSGSGQSQVCW